MNGRRGSLRTKRAVQYLTEHVKRLKLSPTLVLQQLAFEDKWSEHSWERFLLDMYTEAIQQTPANDPHLDKPVDATDALVSWENQPVLDSAEEGNDILREIEKKIKGLKSWQCNKDAEAVELVLDGDTETSLSVPFQVFLPLYPHQIDGIDRILYNFEKHNGLLLGDEMGLGMLTMASA